MLRDHSRESGNLSAVHFQLVLRRAGEAKMNRIKFWRTFRFTATQNSSFKNRVWIGLLVILTVSAVSQAQHAASITGRITDGHKAAVVGAEVRLLARAGSQFTAVTD